MSGPARTSLPSTSSLGRSETASTGPLELPIPPRARSGSVKVRRFSIRTQRILLPIIVVILCISVGWTGWLILLTIYPNDTVNFVMGTREFDGGSFWAIIEPPMEVIGLGVTGLAIVLAGYVFVGIKVVAWGKRTIAPENIWSSARQLSFLISRMPEPVKRGSSIRHRSRSANARELAAVVPNDAPKSPDSLTSLRRKSLTDSMLAAATELTQEHTATRKFANVWVKLGNLGIEFVTIYIALESGYPKTLTNVLTAIISANALSCAIMIYCPQEMSRLTEDLVDFLFDLGAVIMFPMLVLFYCLITFNFDWEAFEINTSIFRDGNFMRMARVMADPARTAIVYKSLNALRIYSVLDFFARVGSNLVLCYRFYALVALLRDPKRHQASLYPRKHPIALVFVFFALATVTFVAECERRSSNACAPHPECSMHAHRWNIPQSDGGEALCPCLVLIDTNFAPRTFDEWLHPTNVTDKVSRLAGSGDLEVIQLINRQLPVFPEELRRCTRLRYVSFMYARVRTLPSWTKEFTNLEYLHIEGSTGLTGLLSLPADLFDDMKRLTFLHIGVHEDLSYLPSFQGLTNLRSMALPMLGGLKEVPEFTHQKKLTTLLIGSSPLLESLPDLAPISETLNEFVLANRGAICCNGFLDNKCDLENVRCGFDANWGTPPATCLPANRTDRIATPATRQLVEKFFDTTCGRAVLPATPGVRNVDNVITKELVGACNGTMYRQCVEPGTNASGICINLRFMAITCVTDSEDWEEMRRRQIAQGLSDPCDPEHEAWLGCAA